MSRVGVTKKNEKKMIRKTLTLRLSEESESLQPRQSIVVMLTIQFFTRAQFKSGALRVLVPRWADCVEGPPGIKANGEYNGRPRMEECGSNVPLADGPARYTAHGTPAHATPAPCTHLHTRRQLPRLLGRHSRATHIRSLTVFYSKRHTRSLKMLLRTRRPRTRTTIGSSTLAVLCALHQST